MSFTITENNSLNVNHKSLSEINNFDDKTINKICNGSILPKELVEFIKNSSWEITLENEENEETKENKTDNEYGKEIDIYSLFYNDTNCNINEKELNIYDMIEEYRENIDINIQITPLSISVQSAKAKMTEFFNSLILARVIANYIDKSKKSSITGVYFKSKEAGDEYHVGKIKKPNPKKKGAFPNGISILIPSPMGTGREINLKIFKNGSCSMTGCKIKEDGIAVIKILEQFIKKQKKLFQSVEKRKNFRIIDFETTMVNSNYSVGFKIDRNRLFDFLQEKFSHLFVSYDPARYAAVKLGFYYNSIKEVQDGTCPCPNNTCTLDKSSGKGCGNGVGKCKRVTVAFFESGNIVITGGRKVIHANEAYNYVNKNIILPYAKYFSLINIEEICK